MKYTKKNILFIAHEAAINGAGRSLLDLLGHVNAYINPVVVAPIEGAMTDALASLCIRFYAIPFIRDFRKIGKVKNYESEMNFADNYVAVQEILKIVECERIDLIYSNSSVVNIGAITAIMRGIPHIWHLREFMEEDLSWEYVDKSLKYELFSSTNLFISVSKCINIKYQKEYKLLSECIYDAIEYEKYENVVKNNGFDDSQLINIMISGIVKEEKGQIDAIKALEILLLKGISYIRLIIVGHGCELYLWELKQYINERKMNNYITIMPYQNDLKSIRELCSISLTCSRMEALGRVSVEAMLAGLIVIGADTGGTLELIGEKEERGYLYREGDAEDLAEKIQMVLLESRTTIKEKLIRAQEFARTYFDSDSYASRIYELINKCIFEYQITDQILRLRNELTKRYNDWNRNGPNYAESWIGDKDRGKSLGGYLEKKNILRVAIYGIGFWGKMLYEALLDSGIEVVCVIDRSFAKNKITSRLIKLDAPSDVLNTVDAIIIAMKVEAEDMKKRLQVNYFCEVFTLAELISLTMGGKSKEL